MANGSATAEAPPPPMAKRDPVSHTLTCKTDQSVKQVTVSVRDAMVFLVGGAGDQERYYVDGPNHNVDYVRDMVDADIEALEIQKSCTTLPLGYNSFMSEEDLERNVIRDLYHWPQFGRLERCSFVCDFNRARFQNKNFGDPGSRRTRQNRIWYFENISSGSQA